MGTCLGYYGKYTQFFSILCFTYKCTYHPKVTLLTVIAVYRYVPFLHELSTLQYECRHLYLADVSGWSLLATLLAVVLPVDLDHNRTKRWKVTAAIF